MASADSDVVACEIRMEGVWLHDPADPAGTALNLRHGSAMRSSSLAVESEASQYAGRVFPVVDYGPHEAESLRVTAIVAHGPAWHGALAALRALVRLRRTLVVRDNRGRVLRGSVAAVDESDQDYGTQVTFTASRGDGV